MRNLRKAGGVVSLASALVLAITVMAYAQGGTTTDPNATNQTTTTDGRTVYPADDYRNDGPDLGWLGLFGLAGLLGLRRRPVVHDRDTRQGRPAHA